MLVQQRDLSVGFDRDQARSLFLSSFDSNLKCVETNADAASTKTSGELFKLLIENINVLSQVQPLSVPGSSPLEQTNIEQAVNALNASTSSAPMTPPPSSNHISDSDKSDTALSNNITPTVNTEKEAERSNKKRKSMDKSEKPSIHLGSLSSPSDTRALLLSPHNSAVKIQSAFRGHIERQAMEKERTLRDLPITSPSTPSSTCKRKNKRRRFSNTPGSARHRRNMTISEGMDENNSNTAESFSPSDEVSFVFVHMFIGPVAGLFRVLFSRSLVFSPRLL